MKKIFFALLLALATVSIQAQITSPVVEARPETDQKYMVGAVPVIDGHATITRQLDVQPGTDAAQVMQIVDQWLQRCMHDDRVRYHQRLDAAQPATIQHSITMELTFSKSFISHDFADLSFVLQLDASVPGHVTMQMTRIFFRYNEADKPTKYAAEELISDEVAFNKKGKLIFGYKKFRLKTIDLMDELAISLQKELKK